jgi:putative transposase
MGTHPWTVSDDRWEPVAPLLPPTLSPAKGGRPRMADRQAFTAIIYLLRTGIQWHALPREVGASSTVHARFQEWDRAGVFRALWEAGLAEYDELSGIDWQWQAGDGVMTNAPFGGAAPGPNPTDRGKSGVKRSLLPAGAGLPLAVVVAGANRPDLTLLAATRAGLVLDRPEPTADEPQHRCLDRGYAYEPLREDVLARGYTAHIRRRGEAGEVQVVHAAGHARRWVVERTHSGLNRSRRLLVRWEKTVENSLACVHLACAQLIFAKLRLSG